MTGIWGVVNVTPDSFSDGGLHQAYDAAVAHAREARTALARAAAVLDALDRRAADLENAPQAIAAVVAEIDAETAPEPDQIAASLVECVSALREGRTPMCEIHENVLSFAMVEAAVAAVERGERVEIDELLEQARVEAIAAEADEQAREIMRSWGSVREALVAGS